MIGVSGSLEVIISVELFNSGDSGLSPTRMIRVLPGLIALLPPPVITVNIDASAPVMDVEIKRSAF
jgi:hypothetical protein